MFGFTELLNFFYKNFLGLVLHFKSLADYIAKYKKFAQGRVY